MPSITPDKDQVEAFKNTRTSSPASTNSVDNTSPQPKVVKPQKTPSTPPIKIAKAAIIFIYLFIAGAGYWLYQQNIKTNAIIASAEQRIADLEHQLSATGEEMGESAVEMKVRIETLGKTSDKLWEEMDKLWASAWRRNQSQIKTLQKDNKLLTDLSVTQAKTVAATNATINDVNNKQVATEFSIDALKEKLTENIKNLSLELSAIESNSQRRDKQQIALASRVTQLSEQNKKLLLKVESLEALSNIPARTAPPFSEGS
ncbi:MAG: hypothetical protein ACJA0T_000368 [Colwellia sp.]|jgi:hypothetical protein